MRLLSHIYHRRDPGVLCNRIRSYTCVLLRKTDGRTMIKRISIDSTLALDQATLNQNFEDAEQRIADLEKMAEFAMDSTGHGSICAVVQGASVTRMRSGTHPDLRMIGLFAQIGDSLKQETQVIIRKAGLSSREVLATLRFKSGENAGKMQIAEIQDDIMISMNDEIEIEPVGTRRVAVFMTFEPVEAV